MKFNDPIFFLLFLPISVAGFALFGRFGRRPVVSWLAIVSLIFYAQWSKRYLLLLVVSILFNYAVSRFIAGSRQRPHVQKAWLVIGIAGNLAALGYFKYFFPLLNFLTQIHATHRSFGEMFLPLGISFFTFTQIAYLVDLAQGAAEPEGLLSYVFFVTYFPHLIAGPILHHKEIMPQVREERKYALNASDVALGLTWFSMGMFKKVIIADNISGTANALFANPARVGTFDTWIGVLAYALQLYFDFSGYSDMAVGLARIFSIRFPFNFNSPYKATSMIDFWQRWHITLTRYIMAYVYTPLLFRISRKRQEKGKKVTRKAQKTAEGFIGMILWPTMFTMFLAGVWHGAGLQYIAYGLLHGVYISVNHLWRNFVPQESSVRRMVNGPVALVITFLCVLVGDVVFRANGLHGAATVYAGMLGLHGATVNGSAGYLLLLLVLLGVVWFLPNTQELLGEQGENDEPNWSLFRPKQWTPSLLWWIGTTAMFLMSAAYSTAKSTFLYFQF